ncbi:hypothetical protein JTE90_018069 [Oedothorax gibbosus]|uniref:Uncharacterized protein n=1 Tax=Oedothorax gibbosus TaxID=931172 RepID=A0AAV6UCH9_9ARAC|nr:hypothetical protein JTE90_018069 [Oedothorax gibbosus]
MQTILTPTGVLFFFVIVRTVLSRTTEFGGYVSGKVVLDTLDSPFEIRKDVIIEGDASLVIRPGVELRFAPGIGITVMRDGILEAKLRTQISLGRDYESA